MNEGYIVLTTYSLKIICWREQLIISCRAFMVSLTKMGQLLTWNKKIDLSWRCINHYFLEVVIKNRKKHMSRHILLPWFKSFVGSIYKYLAYTSSIWWFNIVWIIEIQFHNRAINLKLVLFHTKWTTADMTMKFIWITGLGQNECH